MSMLSNESFLKRCASVPKVQSRINGRINNICNVTDTGERRPFVCSVCDEFIIRKKDICQITVKQMKKAKDLLSWSRLEAEERIAAVEDYYKWNDVIPNDPNPTWLNGMALSPRGSMYKEGKKGAFCFTSCPRCKEAIDSLSMPMNAIINHNYVGCAPKELTDLNEVERAFLTPIHSYGYCFNFQGGKMMSVKGQLTFMRVEQRKLAKAVTTLECMGLTKHVVVLLSGKMTYAQKQKVNQLTTVRTDKMIAAVKWLVSNHRDWKDIDIEEVKKEIAATKPIRVDKSTKCDSGNATVEEDVVFTCYFPDGATTESRGGFDDPLDFKEFVDIMKEKKYDLHYKAELEREFVTSKDGDTIVGACPIQFPYGRCGMNETRENEKGDLNTKCDLVEHLQHLSLVSQKEFQAPLFQLICYTMLSRARLLRTSRLQLKHKVDASTLASGFDAADLSKAIKAKRNRKQRGTRISNSLLDAVDATARELPHTKNAAKTARSNMESMHHHLGNGSVFLTVTFDDENSLLMQVLSDVRVDDDKEVQDLSDDELQKRAKKRETIRIDFPGIAALNFEMMMDVLLSEVLCWDVENDCPTGQQGLFGDLKAVAFAVEEQGRRTLHAHFILWVDKYQELQEAMFFGDYMKKEKAQGTILKYFDHLASTKFFSTKNRVLQKTFDHEGCSVSNCYERQLPVGPTDQHLRDLRHKCGYDYHAGEFATCPHCEKRWTYEEMSKLFIESGLGIRDKFPQFQWILTISRRM